MEWTADALIINARPHGESSAIVDMFTREHGRYGGLVRGGNSRRLRPVLQPGNMVQASWRARLSEHLGSVTVDAKRAYAAEALGDRLKLAALSSLCALLLITPERHAYRRLYDTVMVVFDALDDAAVWLPLMVRFEMALLEETGFGLDLSSCAASGETENLTHVSPRSGRAVSHAEAQPYLDKLFALPAFLHQAGADATAQDIADGFALTGYFLERRVYLPNNTKLPQARERFVDMLARHHARDAK